MSVTLSVTPSAVKQRAGVTVATYDGLISALIDQHRPAIEYAVRPEILTAAGTDPRLFEMLNLAALEIITGDFMGYLGRLPELQVSMRLGDVEIYPRRPESVADPSGLQAQGWARLAGVIRKNFFPFPVAAVLSAGGKPDPGDR